MTPDTSDASEPFEGDSQVSDALDPNDHSAMIDAMGNSTPELEATREPSEASEPTGPPQAATDVNLGTTPEAPGLQFEAPGGERQVVDEPRGIPTIGGPLATPVESDQTTGASRPSPSSARRMTQAMMLQPRPITSTPSKRVASTTSASS